MVNVPSSDKVHVISAWIAFNEKMLSTMSKMYLFIVLGNNCSWQTPKAIKSVMSLYLSHIMKNAGSQQYIKLSWK